MKPVFQSGWNVFLTVFSLIFAVILLTGCPKKTAPLGKGSKTVPAQKGPVSGGIEKKDGRLEGAGPAPLKEEEIPTLVKLEETLESTTPEVLIPEEKAPNSPALTDLFFDFGLWTVRPSDLALLEKNATWLTDNTGVKIEIEGHADSRGTNEYNLVLGEKRANAVKEYLEQLGIDRSRFLVVSYGEERPFCKEENETCYQENRRVHFRTE